MVTGMGTRSPGPAWRTAHFLLEPLSNFSVFWINFVSFPEVRLGETSGSYMSESSRAGGGGGGWTRLYSFKQTSLWGQSFLIPPYSSSAGEPSGLFFWTVNLWWVRSTSMAFTEQHFPLAVFVLAVVEIDGVLLWVTKPREGGRGCFGRYIFSGRCPSPQLTAAFRSQIINNKDSAFRSQGNK